THIVTPLCAHASPTRRSSVLSRRAEHDLRTRGAPARRMTGFIFGTAIGFRLHDFANRGAVCMPSHEILSQQLPGDINGGLLVERDRKSTRLNSSHQIISYAVF